MRITPLKRYGQHFLTSPAVVQQITGAAGLAPGDTVLEIGPGQGVLTGQLLEKAGSVCAVEVDKRLAQSLRQSYHGDPRITIVERDFLEIDLDALLPGRFKVVANLPYYITVPIIERLLEHRGRIDHIVVMVQKEMAARMAAIPGVKDYGSLSVFIQYYATVEQLFDVPPGAFFPAPKVTSTVIKLIPRAAPPVAVADAAAFFAFVRAIFGYRRKMLRAVLKLCRGCDDTHLAALAKDSGIDLSRRAETLDMPALASLFKSL